MNPILKPLVTLGDLLDELFSTFHEWHYFIVGLSIGALVFFILGWLLSLRYGRPKHRHLGRTPR